MSALDKVDLNKIKEQVPELIKDNKGALLGALIGYYLSDNKKAQSTLLGLIAGAVVGDKK